MASPFSATVQPITRDPFYFDVSLARVYAERDGYKFLAGRLEESLDAHLARCQTMLKAATERRNEGDGAYWTAYLSRFHAIIGR